MAIVEEFNPLLNLIGGGVKLQLGFGAAGKVAETPANLEMAKIKENILNVLSTSIGEWPYRPTFGSRLPDLLFDPNDDILKDRAFVAITESIAQWEPRVEIEGIGFPESDPSTSEFDKTLRILIVFKLKGTAQEGSVLLDL
jgi:phage baseplate assembly protein W